MSIYKQDCKVYSVGYTRFVNTYCNSAYLEPLMC